MHSNTLLLLTTLVVSASAAVDFMAIPHVRRELNVFPRATPVNEIRDADPSKCASEALSIAQAIPTPGPDLLSAIAKDPQTDACKFSFPSSLSAEYSSYSSKVLSWYSGHKDELKSLASDCSVLKSYTSLVSSCSDGGSSGSGPNTAAAAPTESGSGSGSDSASKTAGGAAKSTNAGAARETGMAIAALAAAGIAAIL